MKIQFTFLALAIFTSSQLLSQGIPCRDEAKITEALQSHDLTGNGVITVMMDRGIDYRHPDFIDEAGNTRIAYIFDLYDNSGANDADNNFGVGTIYDSDEINAAIASGVGIPTDVFGHGTATTGIICGNGSAVADATQFQGVAPKTKIISIIVTKDGFPAFGTNPGRTGQYNPGILAPAFGFAKEKIAALGLPSVTLLNIGSIGEPTDGTIAFCDLVTDYVNNGHPFVCGVGDDGGQDNHAERNLVQGQETEFVFEKGDAGFLRFVAWYPENSRVQLSIERPNGMVEGPFAPPNSPTDANDVALSQISVFHRGADAEFSNASSPIRQLLIDFSGPAGTYKVKLEATSVGTATQIDAFLNPGFYYTNNSFLGNDTQGGNINAFSSCEASISPGDYVATSNWTDVNGVPRSRSGEGNPGELWLGSSAGPTMDGRLGIDFMAPGEVAHAAYSMDSFYGSFSFNLMQGSGGNYGLQNAVSAAAPLSAGVIALMLEAKPDLTPEQIKTILQETARSDGFTGTTPNNSFGYGKLDAKAALDRVLDLVPTNNPLVVSPVTVSPNPFGNELRLIFPTPFGERVSIRIYSTTGVEVLRQTVVTGERIQAGDLTAGVYFMVVDGDEGTVVERLVKL